MLKYFQHLIGTLATKQTRYDYSQRNTPTPTINKHRTHARQHEQKKLDTKCTKYRWLCGFCEFFTWLDEPLEREPELRLRPLLPLALPLALPELEEEEDRPRRLLPPVRVLLRLREWLRERLRDLQQACAILLVGVVVAVAVVAAVVQQ